MFCWERSFDIVKTPISTQHTDFRGRVGFNLSSAHTEQHRQEIA